MTPEDIRELRDMADKLLDLSKRAEDDSDTRPTSPAAKLKRCSYHVQDVMYDLMPAAPGRVPKNGEMRRP